MSSELPGMPKKDLAAELAHNYLMLRESKKDLQQRMKDAHDAVCAELAKHGRASIRVGFEGEMVTLEVEHIEEQDRIKVRK